MTNKVSGFAQAGYDAVADAFAAGFEGLPTMGAALNVKLDGESVVDLWGGVADERTGRPWTSDTPSVVFSCTKGLVSILVARLVSEGRLDYKAPVSIYWPEFAAAGKDRVTVAQLMSHQAGLSAPRQNLSRADVLDWHRMAGVLAEQEPLWPIGSGYAYHALTHGWLAGELVRRVTNMSVGEYFGLVVAGPLGADAWIGLPSPDADRVAHLQVSPVQAEAWRQEAERPGPNWPFRAMTLGGAFPPALVTVDGGFNDPEIQAAEIPGAGGIATAKALATIWSSTVVRTNGLRLLDDAIVASATQTQSEGEGIFPSLPPYSQWGMGFQLDSDARRLLSADSFGHDGAGGQVGFADPASRLGFGYVTNWMMGADDRRATRIIDALRSALA